MSEISLADYVGQYSQENAGFELGLHQTTISLMLNGKREIYVDVDRKGVIKNAYEIKGVGRFRVRLKK